MVTKSITPNALCNQPTSNYFCKKNKLAYCTELRTSKEGCSISTPSYFQVAIAVLIISY
uniref:Uncharacterized protein n=1 Tax=Arundo donax TaxID=35708 RepID=A0A0A9FTC1_ARUDO